VFAETERFQFIGIPKPSGEKGVSLVNKRLKRIATRVVEMIENASVDARRPVTLHDCREGVRLDYQSHYAGQGKHRGKQFANLAVQIEKLVLATAHIEIGVDFGAENIQHALLLSLERSNSEQCEQALAVRLVRK
jgi:hypothetical protein